jgi:lipopolysaccharide transport system ATP-binding protein
MTVALRVENVSKQYRIYAKPSDRLKESLTRGRLKRHREFWALRDISFEIEKGSTTGIIGPNGSGKSTLLQIITGTLEPTHGSVWYDGRIAALLELGAGFNPEFTGIENCFLNASLMGFSRAQTEALLPEIERFAEIGDFIHQPVKTYSSGMYVRLAFSIAISAAPDILIVDEALAVGDAIFHHRCTRRLNEMQEAGVTVLFVSHDAAAVRALCSRAILLSEGRMVAEGDPQDVLNRYQKIIMARENKYESAVAAAHDVAVSADGQSEEETAPLSYTFRHGDGTAEVMRVDLLNAAGQPVKLVESGDAVRVRMRVRFHAETDDPVCGFLIRNRHGINIYGTNTRLQQVEVGPVQPEDIVEVTFAMNCSLAPDSYSIAVAAHSPAAVSFDWIDGVVFFHVMSAVAMEGVANLEATVTARKLAQARTTADIEQRAIAGS